MLYNIIVFFFERNMNIKHLKCYVAAKYISLKCHLVSSPVYTGSQVERDICCPGRAILASSLSVLERYLGSRLALLLYRTVVTHY